MSNYVLNVLPPRARRDAVARALTLAPLAHFTVRADSGSVAPTWTRHEDGWLTPTGTFQRFFTVSDVRNEHPDAEVVVAKPGRITFLLRGT